MSRASEPRKLAGVLIAYAGSIPLFARQVGTETPTLTGDAVVLASIVTERHGDALTYRFKGAVHGASMSGSLDLGEYLSATWTAKRGTAMEMGTATISTDRRPREMGTATVSKQWLSPFPRRPPPFPRQPLGSSQQCRRRLATSRRRSGSATMSVSADPGSSVRRS